MINLYKTVKENLTLIAVIPTLIGGLSQVFFLAKLSPNLIKFFSLTQLISDGLFVLLFLILSLFTVLPLAITNNLYFPTNEEKKVENFNIKLLYIIIAFLTFMIIMLINNQIFNLKTTVHFIIYLLSIYIIYTPFYYFTKDYFRKQLGKYFLINVFFIINFFFGLKSFYVFNSNYNNIQNFKNLVSEIEKKECYQTTPSILYFNDKFVFIEVESKGKKNIVIKKTEDLFE